MYSRARIRTHTHARARTLTQTHTHAHIWTHVVIIYLVPESAIKLILYIIIWSALRDAVRMRDSHEIHRLIRIINTNPLYLYHLQHDVIEAERIADELDRVMWYKRTVLHMDKKVNFCNSKCHFHSFEGKETVT